MYKKKGGFRFVQKVGCVRSEIWYVSTEYGVLLLYLQVGELKLLLSKQSFLAVPELADVALGLRVRALLTRTGRMELPRQSVVKGQGGMGHRQF